MRSIYIRNFDLQDLESLGAVSSYGEVASTYKAIFIQEAKISFIVLKTEKEIFKFKKVRR